MSSLSLSLSLFFLVCLSLFNTVEHITLGVTKISVVYSEKSDIVAERPQDEIMSTV